MKLDKNYTQPFSTSCVHPEISSSRACSFYGLLLAHLSMCSRGAFRVVMCRSSTVSLNIFSSQTAGPIWTKLGRNVPLEVLFKNLFTKYDSLKNSGCHGNKMEFLKQSLKIFSYGTASQILK